MVLCRDQSGTIDGWRYNTAITRWIFATSLFHVGRHSIVPDNLCNNAIILTEISASTFILRLIHHLSHLLITSPLLGWSWKASFLSGDLRRRFILPIRTQSMKIQMRGGHVREKHHNVRAESISKSCFMVWLPSFASPVLCLWTDAVNDRLLDLSASAKAWKHGLGGVEAGPAFDYHVGPVQRILKHCSGTTSPTIWSSPNSAPDSVSSETRTIDEYSLSAGVNCIKLITYY